MFPYVSGVIETSALLKTEKSSIRIRNIDWGEKSEYVA